MRWPGFIRSLARRIAGVPASYAGGRHDRRDIDFHPVEIGPNALADQTRPLLVRRTRWLGDNHPLVSSMRITYRGNVLAETGVSVRPATRWPELNKRLEERWFMREDASDIGREKTFREQQVEFLDDVFDAGDCLVHHVVAPAHRGLPAGPAIELIPSEQVDFDRNEGARGVAGSGPRIRQGVEFDRLGRRVAYHVMREHPSDGQFSVGVMGDTVRVPASNATLAMQARRPGMVRGIPAIVSVIETLRHEAQLKEAVLDQAVAIACLGQYFVGAPQNSELMKAMQQYGVVDANGRPIVRMEPGLIGFMPPNWDLKTITPNTPAPMFVPTLEMLGRYVGAGVGMGYADATRDESKTNFAASRSEQLKNRKLYRPGQVFVFHVLTRPFYRRGVEWDIASGAVTLTAEQRAEWLRNPEGIYACLPLYSGWEWVNPQQEAQAAEIELRLGLRSPSEIIAQRGRHFKDIVDETLDVQEYEETERRRRKLPKPAPVPAASQASSKPKDDDEEDKDEKPGQPDRLARMGLNGHNGVNGGAHAHA